MASGKKPDPRKRKTSHPHATYLKVANGEKHPGYMAGELYGCYTHRTHSAQPCLSDLTNDALECPYCRSGMVPEWRGYVPIWDRDWTLRYVLIGEDLFASVDVIPLHAQVVCSRAKNPISPLIVRQEVGLTRELPARDPWKQPVFMLPICLTLWKCAELTAWMHNHHQPKMVPSAEKVIGAQAPPPQVKPYRAPQPELLGDELDATMDRIRTFGKSLTNGKPKPKG